MALFAVLAVAFASFAILCPTEEVNATPVPESDLSVTLSADEKTLTINSISIGDMPDYTSSTYTTTKWYAYRGTVETVNMSINLLSVGDYAFKGFTKLKTVDFSLRCAAIGDNAFEGCTGMEAIDIPQGIT